MAAATSQPSKKKHTPSLAYSDQQEEFQTNPQSQKNTSSQSAGDLPKIAEVGNLGSSPSTSNQSLPQEDIEVTSASKANAGPLDPLEATQSTIDLVKGVPLPDLTRGIPSSLDGEASPALSDTGADGSNDGVPRTTTISSSGGGSRGGGGLPRSAYISSIDRRKNRIANFVFATFLLLSVTGSLFLGRNWESKEEENKHPEAPSGWGLLLFYKRVRARLADRLGYYTEPAFPKLLPDVDPAFERPFTLVLSMDDLLVHSEWSREHGWRMAKRPGVDYFLRYLQQYYELVLFTSTPVMMAEQVVRKLDPYRIIMWPLFREATKYVNGSHVKVKPSVLHMPTATHLKLSMT